MPMPMPMPVPMAPVMAIPAPIPSPVYYPVVQPRPVPMPIVVPQPQYITEPIIILPVGTGSYAGVSYSPNQYYGPSGTYPTNNNYNQYYTSTQRPYYDYNTNYNANNNNNNYNDYNG